MFFVIVKRYKLSSYSLHLAVSLLEQYLIKAKNRNQNIYEDEILARSCLCIAVKYAEEHDTGLSNAVFQSLCYSEIRRQDLISMEQKVLQTVGYKVGAATACEFLMEYMAQDESSSVSSRGLAEYVLDRTLKYDSLRRRLPSQLAAGALYIARRATVIDKPAWSARLHAITWYSGEEAKIFADDILKESINDQVQECALEGRYGGHYWERIPFRSFLSSIFTIPM